MTTLINSIRIRNFKSIEELEIELAPLTIFVGPNGSGKTSILEAIALMKQASVSNQSPLQSLQGELIVFQGGEDIIGKGDKLGRVQLGFESELDISRLVQSIDRDIVSFGKKPLSDPRQKEFSATKRLGRIKQLLAHVSREKKTEVKVKYSQNINSNSTYWSHRYSTKSILAYVRDKNGEQSCLPKEFNLTSGNSTAFLTHFLINGFRSDFLETMSNLLKNQLSKVYYLSSERGAIPWTHPSQEPEPKWVGRKGQHTLEILAKLMKPENDEKRLPYELFFESFGRKSVV